jgi:hypothetical protein
MTTRLRDSVTGEWIDCVKFTLDRKTGKMVEVSDGGTSTPVKADYKCRWIQFRYEEQMELARSSRNALLAVQAELYRLHFRSWEKNKPIVLGNLAFRKLGFHHTDKTRALKDLKTAGWIEVEWRTGRAPLVTILRSFA